MPKKPGSFSPSTAWPLRPWTATAEEYAKSSGDPSAHAVEGQRRCGADDGRRAVGERAWQREARARQRVDEQDHPEEAERVLERHREARDQPGGRDQQRGAAAPRARGRGSRRRANPSAAAATCEKYSAANVITIVPRPSVIAAAVP